MKKTRSPPLVVCLRKIWRVQVKSNNLLFLLMVMFMVLYLREHSRLVTIQQGVQGGTLVTEGLASVSQRAVLDSRVARLRQHCQVYQGAVRSQHASIYHRAQPVNKCTGTYFHLKERDYFICNVLKGGSTSWRFFFGENNVTFSFLSDCRPNCPKNPRLRLLQVRHPLERLLATWRHLFKNGGWKSLDGGADREPAVKKRMEEQFSGFTWNYFVEQVVLRDSFFNKTEEELEDFDGSGTWLKHHWAPYWYTCGLCTPGQLPDFILKTESLPRDIKEVLKELGMPEGVQFPDIRVTGGDDNGSEGNKPSDIYIQKYFSQLTKLQVLRLYELYRVDHDMFDYSPHKYIKAAQ